jgi:thiamine-phosphate pyrophosphorylase
MFGSRLYAIIDTALAPRGVPLVAEQLLRAGVRVLQYREKGTFRRQSWRECCALAELARSRNARFIVNDRADVALLCGADGVHLGQEDLPAEQARRLLGEGKIIGFSTHTVQQAREADRLPVDYLAIGPVFATTTKQRADPVVGLETVRAVRAAVRKPLVAIGGITLENAAAVIEAGADAVAVIRDLLVAPDVEARARQFLERLAG